MNIYTLRLKKDFRFESVPTHTLVFLLLLTMSACPLMAQDDIVIGNSWISSQLCLNDGSGLFTCSDIDSVTNVHDLALADIDGGNGTDLVFANYNQANQVCLNDGSASFSCTNVSGDTNRSSDVAVADFDGVNGLDLAFSNFRQNNRVCLNNGSGSFTCSNIGTLALDSRDVIAGDFDGINGPDLVFGTSQYLSNNARNEICFNNGSGGFSCSFVSSLMYHTFGVGAGDFDGVNGLDLAFANFGQPNRVCLNNGSGSFSCSNISSDFLNSDEVAVGDFDSVNGPDLAFANANGHVNRVCLNNGSGGFSCANVGTDAITTGGVAIGQFDGINGLDLAFVNSSGSSGITKQCLNDGTGSFPSCSDIPSTVSFTASIAAGQFGTPLPVELTTFTATADGNDAHLQWQTASETDNAGFEVQIDRSGWQAVDFVEGHGTTSGPQSYSYRITNLEPGPHRFRLKQVDFDGTFEYSPEVEVFTEVPGTHVLTDAYPNPFNPQTIFTLAIARAQHIRIDLFDAMGQRIRTMHNGSLSEGMVHQFRLDGAGLPSGFYVYRVAGAAFAESRSVMLVK